MNAHEFQEKISEYVKEHELIQSGEEVVVALSGGADSVALLHVLLALNIPCSALHCNFGLRGAESDRDETFVRDLCAKFGVQLEVTHFDVAHYEQEHKVSTEMACRELRYEWFESERVKKRADYIAVAHHRDDNIETFFLNMLRGTGINGLSGIKPKNGRIIRPLLCVSRQDVEDYLWALNMSYVTDSTNLENDFKRNKIRNILIPAFKDLFADFETGISRTLDNVMSCSEFYNYSVEKLKNECVIDAGDGIKKVNLKLLRNINSGYRTALYEIVKDYGFNSEQAKGIYHALLRPDCVGNKYISNEWELVIGRDEIELFNLIESVEVVERAVNLENLLNREKNDGEFSVTIVKCNGDVKNCMKGIDGRTSIALNVSVLKENIPFVLRKWRQGDIIHPYGMKGSKLVSDLFVDNKYSESKKRRAKVLAVGNEVFWALGLRATGKYSVKSTDECYLKLSI